MTDRAQFDSRGVHLIPLAGTTILILILVANQVIEQMPDPGSVKNVCLGICGCGACPPSFYALVTGTLAVLWVSHLVRGDLRPSDDD